MPVLIVLSALFVLLALAGCACVACRGGAAGDALGGARSASACLAPWQEDRHGA